TRSLPELTDAAEAILLQAANGITSPRSAISIHHFHGAATRVPVRDTAFGLRENHLMVELIACWEPSEADDGSEHRDWADRTARALEPHASPGGYPNLLGPAERPVRCSRTVPTCPGCWSSSGGSIRTTSSPPRRRLWVRPRQTEREGFEPSIPFRICGLSNPFSLGDARSRNFWDCAFGPESQETCCRFCVSPHSGRCRRVVHPGGRRAAAKRSNAARALAIFAALMLSSALAKGHGRESDSTASTSTSTTNAKKSNPAHTITWYCVDMNDMWKVSEPVIIGFGNLVGNGPCSGTTPF